MVSLNKVTVRSLNLILSRGFADAEDGVIRLIAHCFPRSDRRVQLFYVKNASIALDLLIMFQTIKTVLLR
jgi:hypothetical protein